MKEMERREFLHHTGRFFIFSGLIALSGLAIRKRKNVPEADCRLTNFCQKCTKLSNCNLPQAKEYKQK